MKNTIIAILIVAILAMTLVACGDFTKSDKTIYDTLNDLVALDYQRVSLEVQTTMNGVTLVNNFTSNRGEANTMVTYSVQELATFDQMADSDNYVIPTDMIVTKRGSATIKDGVVIEQNGDSVNISVESLQNLSVKFKGEYFTMAHETYEGGADVFKANVTNVKGFTGNQNFTGTDMTVIVRYKDALRSIIIDYVSANGASVKVIYTFG